MHIEPPDYDRMRAWLAYMFPRLFPAGPLTPDADPIAVLDRMAQKAPARARSGLVMAVSDVVEFTTAL